MKVFHWQDSEKVEQTIDVAPVTLDAALVEMWQLIPGEQKIIETILGVPSPYMFTLEALKEHMSMPGRTFEFYWASLESKELVERELFTDQVVVNDQTVMALRWNHNPNTGVVEYTKVPLLAQMLRLSRTSKRPAGGLAKVYYYLFGVATSNWAALNKIVSALGMEKSIRLLFEYLPEGTAPAPWTLVAQANARAKINDGPKFEPTPLRDVRATKQLESLKESIYGKS